MELSVKTFRWISTLEAISFLVLLGIAMPLKYIWHLPKMVEIVGMAHGVLFVLYVFGAIYMYKKLNWSISDLFLVIICSVVPFGPFYVEHRYLSGRSKG